MSYIIVDEMPRQASECPILNLGLSCPFYEERIYDTEGRPLPNEEAQCSCAWGYIDNPRNWCPILAE